MKLSTREKYMLTALGVAAVAVATYMFAFQPVHNDFSAFKAEFERKRVEYEEFKIKAMPDSSIYADLQSLDEKVKLMTAGLFPEIRQQNVITMLESIFRQAGINPKSVAFTAPAEGKEASAQAAGAPAKAKGINELREIRNRYYGIAPAPSEAPAQAASPNDQTAKQSIEEISFTITFDSNYGQLNYFMTLLELNKRKIVVDTVNTTKNEVGRLTTSMGMTIYAVPKLHDQDNDYLKWAIKNAYGRFDPYSEYGGVNTGTAASSGVHSATSGSVSAGGTGTTPATGGSSSSYGTTGGGSTNNGSRYDMGDSNENVGK